jgi:hypothetical protein
LGGTAKTGSNSTITAVTGLTTPLAINQGGTSQTTANSAFNALVPTQTTSSGKYLTTNGTDTSWGTITHTQTGFGAWVDVTDSHGNTLAVTDGFLVVRVLFTTGSTGRASISTDASNPASTTKTGVSAEDTSGYNGFQTMTCPVKKNDYWIATHAGNATFSSAYWIPLGS